MRHEGDDESSARLGAGPWHLTMQSCGLLLMEIAVGEYLEDPRLATKTLPVEHRHVVRAFRLLEILQTARGRWQKREQEAIAKAQAEEATVAAKELESANRRALIATPQPVSLSSQFGHWEPPPPEAANHTNSALLRSQGMSVEDGGAPGSGACPRPPPSAEVICLKPGDTSVPGMDVGYGPEGAQVQRADVARVLFTDREVMRKTLLRGEARTFASDACDSIQLAIPKEDGNKKQRKALSRVHWEAVVSAALQQYDVGVFVKASESQVEERRGQSYLQMKLPAASDQRASAEFHNKLMQMCQVSLATYDEEAKKRAERQGRKPKTRQANQPVQQVDANDTESQINLAAEHPIPAPGE